MRAIDDNKNLPLVNLDIIAGIAQSFNDFRVILREHIPDIETVMEIQEIQPGLVAALVALIDKVDSGRLGRRIDSSVNNLIIRRFPILTGKESQCILLTATCSRNQRDGKHYLAEILKNSFHKNICLKFNADRQSEIRLGHRIIQDHLIILTEKIIDFSCRFQCLLIDIQCFLQ